MTAPTPELADLLKIVDRLSVTYQAAIFAAKHRPPDPTHRRDADA
jgi:hypothetical protein